MKNILYIVFFDPRNKSSGTEQRTNRLWEKLKKDASVFTVVVAARKTPPRIIDEENRIALMSLLDNNIFQRIFNWLFMPMQWPWGAGLKEDMLPWKKVKFDSVVTRYLGSAALAKAWKIAPLSVDVDDLPSESVKTTWSKRWPFFLRFIPVAVTLMREKNLLKKCKKAFVTNKEDEKYVSRFCETEIFPNEALPPRDGYRAEGRQKEVFLTVGKMDYKPNRDGVKWFVENVWGAVREKFPSMKYRIVGWGLKGDESFLSVPGVEYAGFVRDIDNEYEESLAAVAPVFSGAGTCIKVLEACSRKRKLFATSFAIRGLDSEFVEKNEISVSDGNRQMAQQIIDWIPFAMKNLSLSAEI